MSRNNSACPLLLILHLLGSGRGWDRGVRVAVLSLRSSLFCTMLILLPALAEARGGNLRVTVLLLQLRDLDNDCSRLSVVVFRVLLVTAIPAGGRPLSTTGGRGRLETCNQMWYFQVGQESALLRDMMFFNSALNHQGVAGRENGCGRTVCGHRA